MQQFYPILLEIVVTLSLVCEQVNRILRVYEFCSMVKDNGNGHGIKLNFYA